MAINTSQIDEQVRFPRPFLLHAAMAHPSSSKKAVLPLSFIVVGAGMWSSLDPRGTGSNGVGRFLKASPGWGLPTS